MRGTAEPTACASCSLVLRQTAVLELVHFLLFSFFSFCLRVSSKDNYKELGPFAQVTFNPRGGCNELCTAHPFY